MTSDATHVDLELDARVRAIYISPGHNYVGHHGRDPDAHVVAAVDAVDCVAGKGLVGDRYFGFKEDFKGQITFFDQAVYEELLQTFGDNGQTSDVFRRNVILEGVDLNGLIGKTFRLQNIVFEGSEEARPCYWMNQAFGPGAEAALKGRGGLRARIRSSGTLRVTDGV